MAKKLETSDLSGKLFEKRIGIENYNLSFDKIMRYRDSGKYLLFTYFVHTLGDPRDLQLVDILRTSVQVFNTIIEQCKLSKKMNANYFIQIIGPTNSEYQNISKIIAIKDLSKFSIKEKIFNNKQEFNDWFNQLNKLCEL